MHNLKKIKEAMVEKIEDTYKEHSDLSPNVLSYIDTLAHAAKNINKICEAEEGGDYSMRGSYEGGSNRSYADGMSHGYMPFVYAGESHGGEAYRRGQRRDAMGRYSGEDGYSRGTWDTVNQIEDIIKKAPDEQTRQELQRIAGRLRNG